MTVGLVVVSHSAALASGVRELAAQMAPAVTIAVAGGTDDGAVGTSFDLVTAALGQADSGDGVVVLYDLGSALLTTETALEFSDPAAVERITVVDAPLVEGAVAAAVAAQGGAALAAVAAAASSAGQSWPVAAEVGATDAEAGVSPSGTQTRRTATVADADGLHARPAALLARAAARWPQVGLTVSRPSGDVVAAADVLQLIGLGLRQGESVEITGHGADSADAVATIAGMIDAGMD